MNIGVRYLGKNADPELMGEAIKRFNAGRRADTQDEIWLFELAPVFVQGQDSKNNTLLTSSLIPIIESDRGGDITYHGPGQLIVCILADLKRKQISPFELVEHIEQTTIDLLAELGIITSNKKDAPGIYVNDDKVASFGLRIERGLSSHGIALNVDMDLEPFNLINPCGYEGMNMTQVTQFAAPQDIQSLGRRFAAQFASRLSYGGIEDLEGHIPSL
ncbi:MAG: lipoyl(octanoyl) transferase LipB [Cycloclasticus sp.]|jgi:lipoate-protein ligase B